MVKVYRRQQLIRSTDSPSPEPPAKRAKVNTDVADSSTDDLTPLTSPSPAPPTQPGAMDVDEAASTTHEIMDVDALESNEEGRHYSAVRSSVDGKLYFASPEIEEVSLFRRAVDDQRG